MLGYIWATLVAFNAIRTTRALRVDFLRHTLRQEIAFFDAEAGSIANHVTTNVNLVNTGISEKLGLTIQATASFFASFVVAFAVQWKLTLITLGIVPAILIITGICMGYDAGYETQIMAIHARGGRLAEEAFSSVKNVQAFWAYPKLSRKYRAILDEAGAIGSKKSPIYAGFFAAEWFCVLCGYALAFWQGVRMYSTGEIANPGDVVTYGPSYLLALTHIC